MSAAVEPTLPPAAAAAPAPAAAAGSACPASAPPPPPPAQRDSPARLVGTLALFGLLSGLVIATAYVLTLPRIRRNQVEALERAVLRVLPGATSRRVFVPRAGKLEPWSGEGPPPADAVFAGYQGERLVGYAIAGEGPGFQDTIRLLYGLDPARRRIVGLEILESRETPGLGDKIMKDPAWVACFQDLGFEPEVVGTKRGRAAPNEVDVISGATVSSKAVIAIVNGANARWLTLLLPEAPPTPGDTPPAAPRATAPADGAPAAGREGSR